MYIGIVGRHNGSNGASTSDIRERMLAFIKHACTVYDEVVIERETINAFEFTASCFTGDEQESLRNQLIHEMVVDIIVVFGGDGTMLNAAKSVALGLSGDVTPLIGVNHGRVGFITDLPGDASPEKIIKTINEGKRSYRSLLSVSVAVPDGGVDAGGKVEPVKYWDNMHDGHALNDVVLRSNGSLLQFDVYLNSDFAYTTRSDGLIIATPTGSTAYAMSAGGSIIPPSSKVIEIIPLLPQTLSYRSLVIDDSFRVTVKVTKGEGTVVADGGKIADIVPGSVIEVKVSKKQAIFLQPSTHDYFETLRTKLNWHLEPGK